MTRNRALLELIFAGALWGFGFVATVWALESFNPVELLILRFACAAIAGELAWRLFAGRHAADRSPGFALSDLKCALPAGLLMAGLLLPQTIGLQYTTAAKSGFLTTLYVIFVPLITHWILRRPIAARIYVYAGMALLGAFFLMGASFTDVNPGDLWTLLCALVASLHILYIEHISPKIRDAFRFNNFQTLFCLLGMLPFLVGQSDVNLWHGGAVAWAGVFMLAIGSTVIGFTIQIRAQRILDSTTASMLFLLESPFALIFGVVLLQESFGLLQAAGAVLILTAALLTVWSSERAKRTKTTPQ